MVSPGVTAVLGKFAPKNSSCFPNSILCAGVLILGGIADEMCLQSGITDSRVYLEEALKHLGKQKISHLALSIEAKRPKIVPRRDELIANIATLMGLLPNQVGLTATTGEGLTDFGCGDGIQVFCTITTIES